MNSSCLFSRNREKIVHSNNKPDGMNARVRCLRKESEETIESLSIERALITTRFYRKNLGIYSVPVMRALNFFELCKRKTIYIGENELIVGERGPKPRAVPTFPELTCHSAEDLKTLNSREKQRYFISEKDIRKYEKEVIPFWKGKTMRERIFKNVPKKWMLAYKAGVFTEFMEQRAPGHTALDGKIYKMGMLDFKKQINLQITKLDFLNDYQATDKLEELKAMDISCDAVILFAERHAKLAVELASKEKCIKRKNELFKIAEVCRNVPAYAPQNFWEAIQMYWFVHLATITELNGWDAMNPGHFDQHLSPFYKKDIINEVITPEKAKELISCFWIKVNNHPAPPKVGTTARESGTYNDFTNINIGGLTPDGTDAVNEVSYMLLEVAEELHLLQPGCSVHISEKTPNDFLFKACKLINRGYGFPSVFNPDIYVKELVRQGKSLSDAREGGCSGCIEVGAFGKEAFILTGYLNLPKILEITLNRGKDPITGKKVGVDINDSEVFDSFEKLYSLFFQQLEYFVNLKVVTSNFIDRMFAKYSPAPFLSVVIDDCIVNGKDYYNGGARYNTNYIQCTGLGTITDSFSAIKKYVFNEKRIKIDTLINILNNNFKGEEILRQQIINHTPCYGNNDDCADEIAVRIFHELVGIIDGLPNCKGGKYHMNMLSTTCHVYFGKVLGATPDGRLEGKPISDGTSPSHGADINGPTAVISSLGKLKQNLSGGTLLNIRFSPDVLKRGKNLKKLGYLIRSYFKLGGHHVQFNIVGTDTLKKAQKCPEEYRDLMVRVAGYSDYFNDIGYELQQEIIERTQNEKL